MMGGGGGGGSDMACPDARTWHTNTHVRTVTRQNTTCDTAGWGHNKAPSARCDTAPSARCNTAPSASCDTALCTRPGCSARAAWVPWVCSLCTQPSFDSMHCFESLFGSLFLNTVHGHCSRGFQKNKIK